MISSNPLISIIIPTYNRAKLLPRAIVKENKKIWLKLLNTDITKKNKRCILKNLSNLLPNVLFNIGYAFFLENNFKKAKFYYLKSPPCSLHLHGNIFSSHKFKNKL